LEHLADDLLAIRDSLRNTGRMDPSDVARFKIAAAACREYVPELKDFIKDVEKLVDQQKSASGSTPSQSAIDQLGEFAGTTKGTARTLLTLSEPNK
jgi:hypothetical protein